MEATTVRRTTGRRRKQPEGAWRTRRNHRPDGHCAMIISIMSTFTVPASERRGPTLRLTNSSRQFASHSEKARADAVRRHAVSTVRR